MFCGYFFGTVSPWRKSKLVAMDKRTGTIMVKAKVHHMQAAKERLYLPRSHGGRGLENVEVTWEREAVGPTHYLMRSEDP